MFPQGSILGPLHFLVYINDLPDHLESNVEIFADDASLFSIVDDQISCANRLNSDLRRINDWAYQWKMSFNPDPLKSAVDVYFTRKNMLPNAPHLFFKNGVITRLNSQKHPGLVFDKKLSLMTILAK